MDFKKIFIKSACPAKVGGQAVLEGIMMKGEDRTAVVIRKPDNTLLMFVMVISLLLFSLLGWPDLFWRITSRLLLIPIIAGLSYELLRWAGRSDSMAVKILSIPGLLLQKLTTKEPDEKQLEVAAAAMKAVLVPADTPAYTGDCDQDGRLIETGGRPAEIKAGEIPPGGKTQDNKET